MIATSIFQILPDNKFDQVFKSEQERQRFIKVSVDDAHCVEFLELPRFQDYLLSRWRGGAAAWHEDIESPDDYWAFCKMLLHPTTLILSPRMRFYMHALSFVVFTSYLLVLPEDFFIKCDAK